MKVPHEPSLEALSALALVFLSYVLSFIYVGIYWNNHHHLLHACKTVNGRILWANLHLLFWLSLFPFVTGWMGENHFAPLPTALYALILLAAALAYWLLQQAIIATQGEASALRSAIGRDWKGKASPLLYLVAVAAAFYAVWLAQIIFALVALIWLVPDRRIERSMPQDA
ncbi:MAG: hypothetical protein B7Y53_00690 [Halothiobacillus sp. 28-55-5]|nr:MAG: hypothetical protein B7Y53_00690 [Halothiobacillus sp. 28-55-5]